MALMGAVGEAGRGVCMAIVDPIDFEWVFDIQTTIGRPLNWCQLMTWPENSRWLPSTKVQLDRQGERRASVRPIYGQATCKPVTQQITFANPIPLYPAAAFGETAALDSAGAQSAVRNQGWRRRADADLVAYNDPDWSKWIVAETGRTRVSSAAPSPSWPERSGKHPLEAALDLALA